MIWLVIILLILLFMNVSEVRRLNKVVAEFESKEYVEEFSEHCKRLIEFIIRNEKMIRSLGDCYVIGLRDINNFRSCEVTIYKNRLTIDDMDFWANQGQEILNEYDISAIYEYTKMRYETIRLDKLTESLDRLDLVSEEYKEEYKND